MGSCVALASASLGHSGAGGGGYSEGSKGVGDRSQAVSSWKGLQDRGLCFPTVLVLCL